VGDPRNIREHADDYVCSGDFEAGLVILRQSKASGNSGNTDKIEAKRGKSSRIPQQVMPLKSEIANCESPKSDLLKY
jgi:hypothetical protein